MTNGLVLMIVLMISGSIFSLANIWVGMAIFGLGIIAMLGAIYASYLKDTGRL